MSTKLLLLSDLHFKNRKSDFQKAQKILEKVEKTAEKPAAIILAGDVVDSLTDFERSREALKSYLALFTRVAPVFVGFGNHDLSSWKTVKKPGQSRHVRGKRYQLSDPPAFRKYLAFLRKIPGLTPLHNNSATFRDLEITGVTLPPEYYNIHKMHKFVQESPKILRKTLKLYHETHKTPKKRLVLLHSPALLTADLLEKFPENTLVVAGHMHSGAVPRPLEPLWPDTRGLISPERKWLPRNARAPKPKNARAPRTRSARGGQKNLLILPAVTTFPGALRPLNFLFPPRPVIIDL